MSRNNTEFDNGLITPFSIWLVASALSATVLALIFGVIVWFGGTLARGLWGVSRWWDVAAPALVFGTFIVVMAFLDAFEESLVSVVAGLFKIVIVGCLVGAIVVTWKWGIAGTFIIMGALLVFLGLLLFVNWLFLCLRPA